jgi:hypothetical protein
MSPDPVSHLNTRFPNAGFYHSDRTPFTLREAREPFRHFPYSERHLQCLWADARLRPGGLRSTEGESIEVEHPGEWNLEAGPDFTNAVLRIGKDRRRMAGDLEIHIHPNGWRQHGHHRDPRYEQVRFHLVYFPGSEIRGLIQIPLQELLCAKPRFSFESIDITAYPYSIPADAPPLQTLHPDRKTHWLECAGEARLQLKAERLAYSMQRRDPEQVLWEELLAALGYKHNKAPARQLAGILPLARIRALAANPDQAYALLLGLSGLMPANLHPDWDTPTRRFARRIWDFWWRQNSDLKEQSLDPRAWTCSGLRPVNHPVRRLMAAAGYAFRISDLAFDNRPLRTVTSGYWDTHLTWNKSCAPTAIVGASRANAMITNILVPWRAAIGRAHTSLRRLPAEPVNGTIRQTAHILFGPDHSPGIYRSALARQGLIQIFHDYVITHRLAELESLTEKTAPPSS